MQDYIMMYYIHTVRAGVEAWLDATVYEVFILPNV